MRPTFVGRYVHVALFTQVAKVRLVVLRNKSNFGQVVLYARVVHFCAEYLEYVVYVTGREHVEQVIPGL